MKKSPNQIKSFVIRVVIVFAVILLVTLLYWWINGLHTKDGLKENLFVAGAITIVIGAFLRMTSREGTYGTIIDQSYFVSKTTMDERINQGNKDLDRSWADLMVLSGAGFLAILLGWAL